MPGDGWSIAHQRGRAKARAISIYRRALRSGVLVRPAACERCGGASCGDARRPHMVYGHHDDYSRPLDVQWLCHSCHWERHHELSRACVCTYRNLDMSVAARLVEKSVNCETCGTNGHRAHECPFYLGTERADPLAEAA